MMFSRFILLAAALLLLLNDRLPGHAATVLVSQGTFLDAAGAKHPWRINDAQALIWDGSPYLPVGGVFQARSWRSDATEEDWASDLAALRVLKERGVTDLYVQPARAGLTAVPPGRVQRLLDSLDREGFTYGISINDGPREPLIGYVVRPGAFRQAGVAGGALVRFPITNLGSSLYFIARAGTTELVQSGEATRVADGARVVVPQIPGDLIVFLVPEKIYLPDEGLGLPNLWDGFDRYRDALLSLFAQVKLGKGFRFFVDPLPPDLALREESSRLIPSGMRFAAEWSAWLERRYRHVDALHSRWAMPERNLSSVSAAAHLLPLWSGDKGVGAFYNKAEPGKTFPVDAARSHFWSDLETFKTESVRGYMNTLADVLKREVADVPVVYRWTGYSPLFSQITSQGGFDGLGIEAYGRGSELVTRSAGYAYAQAAQAPKTLWLPVTGTRDTRTTTATAVPGTTAPVPPATEPPTGPVAAAAGYPSRASLFSDLDWLREIGAKGFFVNGLRVVGAPSGASSGRAGVSLVDTPEQLNWLRDYKTMLAATSGLADDQPRNRVVFYPRSQGPGSLKALAGNRWWLPTDQPAATFDFGPVGRAYALATEQGIVYYLWNPRGPRQIRLRLPKTPKGVPPPAILVSVPATERKGVLTLTIGPEPVSIRNLPSPPVPMETVPELLKEAESLLALARKQSRPEGTYFLPQIAALRERHKNDDSLVTVEKIQTLLHALRTALRPYGWLEAEGASQHSFDESRERPGASDGRVLMVGARPAENTPPVATYPLSVKEAGTYDLWVAASPDAPLAFRLNGQPVATGGPPQTSGAVYADGLIWTRIGQVVLSKGGHTLEMQANGPAIVDTLLIIRGPFSPDGPNPPPVIPPAPEK